MSIDPTGVVASAAGAPVPQRTGSEVERTHAEVVGQRRQVCFEARAEAAAGIGQPDGEDHETDERSADGRRPWEEPPPGQKTGSSQNARRSTDPSRQRGNLLDLDG